jgi:type II secretory ATPase GspE/PulE/Tfp pilus assembly ATPase PilB-like protein
MSDDTALINMKDVKEKITEQVKVSFMNLIPPNKFKDLVDAELKAFFEDERKFTMVDSKESSYGYNERWTLDTPMTPFRQMVWQEVRKLATEKFEEVKTTTDWAAEIDQVWDEEKQEFTKVYQTEAASRADTLAMAMASQFFKHIVTTAMQSTTSDMNQDFDKRVEQSFMNLNVNVGYI